jgi:hypothetical protein
VCWRPYFGSGEIRCDEVCDGALTREKSTHFWTYICSYLLLQRLGHRQLGAAMARPPSHLVQSKSITHFSVFSVAASSRPFNADQQSFVHRWGPIPALTRWPPAIALPNGQRAQRVQPSRMKYRTVALQAWLQAASCFFCWLNTWFVLSGLDPEWV